MLGRFTDIRIRALASAVFFIIVLAACSAALAQSFSVEDEDCLACHDGIDKGLISTAHRLSSTIDKPAVMIQCVSCHSGAETHFDDPGRGTISNPALMEPVPVEELCTTCHESHLQMQTIGFDPHVGLDLSCTSCHSVHGTNDKLLIDATGSFCGSCHVAVVNDFRRRSNHPLVGQNVGCIDCHGFTQGSGPDYGHGQGANCSRCHPQQAGPFLFEHEGVNSFTPEGDGCVACHSPHGSSNDRLLTQPGERLCLQCHMAPPGHATAHGGNLAAFACMACHSEIHGSYDNLYLLDPQLGDKLGSGPEGCFCHYYR